MEKEITLEQIAEIKELHEQIISKSKKNNHYTNIRY